jgi:hypothetical protein
MALLQSGLCGVGRNERLSRWQRMRRRVALELRYFLVRRLSGNTSRVDLESFPKEGGTFTMSGDRRALLLNVKKGLPVSVAESGCPALGFACAFFLFGFFEDADSHVAPRPNPGIAVGAGYETVICRMVGHDEFIAAALRASEGSVRHGACRPFWPASANLISPGNGLRDYAPEQAEVKHAVPKPCGAWLLQVCWPECRAGQGIACEVDSGHAAGFESA